MARSCLQGPGRAKAALRAEPAGPPGQAGCKAPQEAARPRLARPRPGDRPVSRKGRGPPSPAGLSRAHLLPEPAFPPAPGPPGLPPRLGTCAGPGSRCRTRLHQPRTSFPSLRREKRMRESERVKKPPRSPERGAWPSRSESSPFRVTMCLRRPMGKEGWTGQHHSGCGVLSPPGSGRHPQSSPPGSGMDTPAVHKTSLHLRTEAQEDLDGWKGKGQVPARQCSRVLFGAHTWKVLTCSAHSHGLALQSCFVPASGGPT